MQDKEYSESFFHGLHATLQRLLERGNCQREADGKPRRSNDLKSDSCYSILYSDCKTKFRIRCVSG